MGGAKSTDRPAEPHVALAIALRLGAALSLALMFAGVKWVSQRGVSFVESLFYRQVGTAVCAAIWVSLGPGIASLRTKRVGAHVARMSIGLVAMGLNFLAMILLPLAEATSIGFSVRSGSTSSGTSDPRSAWGSLRGSPDALRSSLHFMHFHA